MKKGDGIYKTLEMEETLKRYNKAINNINLIAYNDTFMLSNDVLSRNTYGNKLLEKVHKKGSLDKEKISLWFIFLKVNFYYFKSFSSFFIWFLQKIIFSFSGYKSRKLFFDKEIILIDTFFMMNDLEKNNYQDKTHLKGLDETFDKNGVEYSYLPVFYGGSSLLKFYSTFKAFKKKDIDFITEYELLGFKEIIDLIVFIFLYPFHVISLCRKISSCDVESELIRDELILTLDKVTWKSYIRYLIGRKASSSFDRIKLISWCEYQTIDKNLYKGIRESCRDVKIFGCQFFIQYGNWVNTKIPESEIDFGVTPDVVLVNGPQYLKDSNMIDYRLGGALRFNKLFESNKPNEVNESIVNPIVLLSYQLDESEKILKMLSKSKLGSISLSIKTHPALRQGAIKKLLLPDWTFVGGDLYERINDKNLVVVTASGTAVEAVSMGKSVIIIGSTEGITTNPMLHLGKGYIWDIATSSDEISSVTTSLMEYRKGNPEKIMGYASEYKKRLFNNASDSEILQMFEIKLPNACKI